MMCEMTLSVLVPKIRNGPGRSRKLWPKVRYADTLTVSVVNLGQINTFDQKIRPLAPRDRALELMQFYILNECSVVTMDL